MGWSSFNVRRARTGKDDIPSSRSRAEWVRLRHLIADNIGWFKDSEETQGGKLRTVEDFVKAKGETVRRGKQLKLLQDGETVEYVVEDQEAAEGVSSVESKSAP